MAVSATETTSRRAHPVRTYFNRHACTSQINKRTFTHHQHETKHTRTTICELLNSNLNLINSRFSPLLRSHPIATGAAEEVIAICVRFSIQKIETIGHDEAVLANSRYNCKSMRKIVVSTDSIHSHYIMNLGSTKRHHHGFSYVFPFRSYKLLAPNRLYTVQMPPARYRACDIHLAFCFLFVMPVRYSDARCAIIIIVVRLNDDSNRGMDNGKRSRIGSDLPVEICCITSGTIKPFGTCLSTKFTNTYAYLSE